MLNLLVTGVTGVLGSETLYNLLNEKLNENKSQNIYVLIRARKGAGAQDRLREVFSENNLPNYLSDFSTEQLMSAVTVIEGECSSWSKENLQIFRDKKITLVHVASSVNLGKSDKVRREIIKNNYQATVDLIESLGQNIARVIYVSTAFASGRRKGLVTDDYLSLGVDNLQFRNHYEEFKYKAEQTIVEKSKKFGFSYTIARPSVICGRMLDNPTYYLNRYTVFYLVGTFLNKMKGKEDSFRIVGGEHTDLNIIPVDYVAKALTRLVDNTKIDQINIVSSKEVPIQEVLTKMFAVSGFHDYSFVENYYENTNYFEKIYYKTAGEQLSDYFGENNAFVFDARKVRELMSDIEDPNISEQFTDLYTHAHAIDFDNANVAEQLLEVF